MNNITIKGIFLLVLLIAVTYTAAAAASLQSSLNPAFDDWVSSDSDVSTTTGLAYSSSMKLRTTADSADSPAEMDVRIDVRPVGSGEGNTTIADIRTAFAASITEANLKLNASDEYYSPGSSGIWNDYWDEPAAVSTYLDTTAISGEVDQYTKHFNYRSGARL